MAEPRNTLAPVPLNKLWYAAKQFLGDSSPGGSLNPEWTPARTDAAKAALGFTPLVGDALSGYDAVQAARQGNYGEAALNAVGLLPFVPPMAGITKNLSKIGENTYEFIAKNNKKYHITVDPEEGMIRTFAPDKKVVGELEAAPVSGYSFSKENGAQAAWMGVDDAHQRNGLNTAMNAVALENIPGFTLKSNMFTPEGQQWYNAVMSRLK